MDYVIEISNFYVVQSSIFPLKSKRKINLSCACKDKKVDKKASSALIEMRCRVGAFFYCSVPEFDGGIPEILKQKCK